MLFIHPMWDSESERIGKRKCTPRGYALHGMAEMLGFVGLLSLLGVPALWAWKGFHHTFALSQLWLAAIPIVLGVVSEVLFQYSWWMALKRGFRYDAAQREASWDESGERRTYKWMHGDV